MNNEEKLVKFNSRILIIGMGTVGQAVLPLFFRNFEINLNNIRVIDSNPDVKNFCNKYNVAFYNIKITEDNYKSVLDTHVSNGDLVLQLAINVCTYDLAKYCREKNIRYIDTSVEGWDSAYINAVIEMSDYCDYEEREKFLSLNNDSRKLSPTIISGSGANPGLVNIFIKKALINLAEDEGLKIDKPKKREEWAGLSRLLGIQTIQISERDAQKSKENHPVGSFYSTWCIDGYYSESMLPSEVSWGTIEDQFPDESIIHSKSDSKVVHINKHGHTIHMKTWVPSSGEISGHLITHTEPFSISDYLTIHENNSVIYRPTCYFVYHACDNAVDSLKYVVENGFVEPKVKHIMKSDIISGGYDEVGVLIIRKNKSSYWYGSTLTIDEARSIVENTNATALQVAAGVLVSLSYATKNPWSGILETDDIDYEEALKLAAPYLGKLDGYYTDWKPSQNDNLKFQDFIK